MERKSSIARRGLQTRGKFLLLLIPMMIISLATMTFLNIHYIMKSTSTALEESLCQMVEIAASRITDRAKSDISLASSMAGRISVLYADRIESFDASNESESKAFEEEIIRLGEAYGFMHMYVIGADGYARTVKHSNIKEADPVFYQPVANGADSYITDPTLDTALFAGQYKINVVVPVSDADGSYIGMLVCMVNASELCDLVADIKVGDGGSTFIMDGNGRCIAHQDPEMLYGGEKYLTVKDSAEYPTLNRLWDDMRSYSTGYTEYEYGGERLAAYTGIDNINNWTLAVTVSENEFMEQATSAVLTSIIVATILILICGVLIIRYLNVISKRIGGVTDRLEAMAEGDISNTDVAVQTTDEIGRLEAASNKLSGDLHSVIDRIDECLSEMSSGNLLVMDRVGLTGDFAVIDEAVAVNKKKLSDMILNISRTSEEVSRGSAQMATGASSLAQGAAEQASSVEELFSSVTNVAQKAQAMGGYRSKRQCYNDGKSEDESSSSLMEKLVVSMSGISESAKLIKRIASDIDSLASETGMLALNASVEATHAGEFGKGFAVIATEVRALSEKSRDAARSAEKMIDDIMKAIEKGTQTVEYTVDSVDEMVVAISQFKNALEQISNVIESTAATAEETASSSEELSTQAEILKEMISGFTYDEDEA